MKRILYAMALVAVVAMMPTSMSGQKQLKKLMNAEFAISQFYVDSVNEDKLVEDAIRGMLEQLDPHSSYSTPEETRELEEPLEGEFSGIGIQFNMQQDTLYVIQTIVGGPAERVGMLAGDRIVQVEDTVIAGMKMRNTRIMKMLRGKKGSKVNVMVKRRGTAELIPFRITRDDIPLYSIDATYMADRNTGYVKVSRFGKKTDDEFNKALSELSDKGMTQLIIDLTNNGGGYLQTAVELANTFLERGNGIVYTQGNNSSRYDAKANGRGKLADDKFKVVVMVDQYSASASEILAGALQDWDRAVIVGRRTFGKGLVQRPFRFEDGSMIRLTVARYYTPSGRCIQKPYTAGDREGYEKDIYNRFLDGELANADSIHLPDSLKYSTLKSGRVIYGGGGIMPDVFVPLDTTEFSDYYRDLVARGTINQYVIDYVDKHRKELSALYATVADYDRSFVVDSTMLHDLKLSGMRDSIEFDSVQYVRSKALIADVVKALIARDVYADVSAYNMVINHRDPIFKEALRVINDDARYRELLSGSRRKSDD